MHVKYLDNSAKKVILKDETIAECLVVSSQQQLEQQFLTRKWLFQLLQENRQRAVSGLLATIQLRVLVLEHKRTPVDIR